MAINDNRYLSLFDAAIMVIFVVAALLAVGVAMPSLYDSVVGRIVVGVVAFGGPAFTVGKVRRLDWAYLFPRRKYEHSIGPFFLIFASLFLLERVVHELEDILAIGLPEYIDRRGEWIFSLDPERGTHFFSLVFIGPIMEELFFRGLILGSFLKRYNHKTAVILSAFLFGVLHINFDENVFSSIVFPFADGIVLAWVLIRSNNIVVAIACHAFRNLLNYVLPLILVVVGGGVQTPRDLVVILTMLCVLALLFAWLARRSLINIYQSLHPMDHRSENG